MNDALIEEIYKNSERVRIKNQVEEKLLYQLIEGHKGFREKLNKALSRIEKTRQTIAQDYYYMEKEMRMLGLSPRTKKTSTATAKHSRESNTATTPLLSSISQHPTPASTMVSKGVQSNLSIKPSSIIISSSSKQALLPNRMKPTVVGANKTVGITKSNLVSDSGTYKLFSRSNSMIGLKSSSELPPTMTSMTTKSLDVDEAAALLCYEEQLGANFKSKELEEKCSPVPPTYMGYSAAGFMNNKNSSKSDLSDFDASNSPAKHQFEANASPKKPFFITNDAPLSTRRQSAIGFVGIGGKVKHMSSFVPRRKLSLDNGTVPLMAQTTSFIKSLRSNDTEQQKPKRVGPFAKPVKAQAPAAQTSTERLEASTSNTNQRSMSPFQNEASTCSSIYSASKTESDFQLAQKASQVSYSRKTSATSNRDSAIVSLHLPKIMNRSSSSIRTAGGGGGGSTSKRRSSDDANLSEQRRVSFGRIELNQMEMPNVFKYSSTGLERYKFNPHYYLPDGTLKRKFSLPKLSESLEAVKNCRYLRRFSLESAEQHASGVENIFKDLQPNSCELGEFDVLSQNE